MLGDFASLDVQNTYRGSDAYGLNGLSDTLLLLLMGSSAPICPAKGARTVVSARLSFALATAA
ncbi:hypothetical protein [Piscirickettsia salmonis]|uniref:hypothetical protein n=1 Tax=Piscirickettsia salmonis TaxID=1238 RepID=UPI001E5886C9|nr:hypothetical protein [Piscirickettsia salmonis]